MEYTFLQKMDYTRGAQEGHSIVEHPRDDPSDLTLGLFSWTKDNLPFLHIYKKKKKKRKENVEFGIFL